MARNAHNELPYRPIDHLNREWEAHRHSAESRKAFQQLVTIEPQLATVGAADLGDLIDWLSSRRGAAGRAAAATVVRAMVRSQGAHRMITRAILQAVLPGLVGVARRLSWGSGGDWPDGGAFFTDTVTTAWEVVVEWSGQDRPYAVLDLLSAVRCRLRRQILRQRNRSAKLDLGMEPEDAPAVALDSGITDLETLARAIEAHGDQDLDRLDGAVLYANRVLGLSMAEMSQRTGISRFRLEHRRERAIRTLLA